MALSREPSQKIIHLRVAAIEGTAIVPFGNGFLVPAAAPWSIRERTAALGGALRVRSRPGRGAEIMVTIPAAGPGGRYGSDRRMHA